MIKEKAPEITEFEEEMTNLEKMKSDIAKLIWVNFRFLESRYWKLIEEIYFDSWENKLAKTNRLHISIMQDKAIKEWISDSKELNDFFDKWVKENAAKLRQIIWE